MKYGSNFLSVLDEEFKIQDWQAVKKIEHAVCFGLQPTQYGFSQDLAREINAKGGLLDYVRKGKPLQLFDLIRDFQIAIKKFCEDQSIATRNDQSIFNGKPSIIFADPVNLKVVIFNKETKVLISAYKISERAMENYLQTGNIGSQIINKFED